MNDFQLTNKIAIYSRVSTLQQEIHLQISSAESYISKHFSENVDVAYYSDNGVSANKISLTNRQEIQRLLTDVENDQIHTIIAYSRDRLARNFYEYTSIIQVLHKHQVQVIFTASNQMDFSDKMEIEAFQGIFTQVEGSNIATRTADTRKRYPSATFGFERLGEKPNIEYEPDKNAENVLQLFESIYNTNTSKEFFNVLLKFKPLLKNKKTKNILKILQNPFYAGLVDTLNGMEKLVHVTPIVDEMLFKEVQNKLSSYSDAIAIKVLEAEKPGYLIPTCRLCYLSMKFKEGEIPNDSKYYCCSKHKRVEIKTIDLNKHLLDELIKILDSIPIENIKIDVLKEISVIKNEISMNYEQQKAYIKRLDNKIVNSLNDNQELKRLVLEKKASKEILQNISKSMEELKAAQNEMNNLSRLIKEFLNRNVKSFDPSFIIPVFFSKVTVSHNDLVINAAFGSYFEVMEGIK